jgi:CheY-like chemotaxis protein
MVARIIRSTPGLAKTYLIALTGFGSEDAKEVSRKAGFDTHLTKPVDPEALQLLISHLSVQVSLT